MNKLSILVLAGLLAAVSPNAAQAGGRKLVVMHPQGTVHMKIHGDGVNINASLPLIKGRIELEEGPDNGYAKQFMLTKLILGVHPFIISHGWWGQTRFDNVGVHLRDGITWWANPLSNGPVIGGAWKIEIPSDQIYKIGDPLLLGTGIVTQKGKARIQAERDRGDKPITGVIDFDQGILRMTITLNASEPAPWWQPWASGLERTFTIELMGAIPGPVMAPVDPEEPPTPERPIVVKADAIR